MDFADAVVCWVHLVESDSESHVESLGDAFSLLARYHVYAKEILPAVSAGAESYRILVKSMPLVTDENTKKMQEAMSSWTLSINSLYSTNTLEGLLYAQEYLTAWRALLSSNPATFREEKFSKLMLFG